MGQVIEDLIKEYEEKVDRMEDMFYNFMFISDPLEIVKLQAEKKEFEKGLCRDARPNETKLITRAAMLELCGKALRRSELVGALSGAFHRRKVLEVVAILEQLGMVRVLYRSGHESAPDDQDLVTANKNLIITATSSPQLGKMISELRGINRDLELVLSSILRKD